METMGNAGRDENDSLAVVIVGCGLGGLACAIQCRREGLKVLIVEKSDGLNETGAGVQVTPNATRILRRFGLIDKLLDSGMVATTALRVLRWEDGSTLIGQPNRDWCLAAFGEDRQWVCERNGHSEVTMLKRTSAIHRADYQRVLANEAQRLGAEIRFDCDVLNVECHDVSPTVVLSTGERITADVVVGGDGIRSSVRTGVLGSVKEPKESGELAYRTTVDLNVMTEEERLFTNGLLEEDSTLWGPDRSVVLYKIRGGEMVNVVLLCPDDLPAKLSKQAGNLAELRKLYEGWDPRLRLLLSKVEKALKWKIWIMDELDSWIKGSVALLGDSCHPTRPHMAQGAALAIEDAAALGRLLGLFVRAGNAKDSLPALMRLYEDMRKERACSIVKMADNTTYLYHMPDGPEQEHRDQSLRKHDWSEQFAFPGTWLNSSCNHQIYTYDAIEAADKAFAESKFARAVD